MSFCKFLKYWFLLLLIISNVNLLFSQQKKIVFQPKFLNQPLKKDFNYTLKVTDSVEFSTFKFYISQLELFEGTKSVWKEEESFHLVDVFDVNTLALSIPINVHFTKIKFQLGIDSVTNVSGAMGGDLDPTKGMYWTWQSGYINVKLEGKSNLCKNRHNEFQYHLGGYLFPFNSIRTIYIPVEQNNNIKININLEKFFDRLSISQYNHIMSPSKEAVYLSAKISESFSVSYE